MTRTRIPWPWEGKLPPADARRLLDAWRAHAATAYPDSLPGSTQPIVPSAGGELSGARDTTADMERRILDMTDHTPAAREWAASKARTARDWYDTAVRSGQMPHPTKR